METGDKNDSLRSASRSKKKIVFSSRYCQSVGHFTAKSDTQLNISKRSLINVFPFCLKNFIYSIEFMFFSSTKLQ